MEPSPATHLRIARPSHDLQASERFWVDGLGLDVLFRVDSSAEGGHVPFHDRGNSVHLFDAEFP
jgi:hypothetical protein